MIQNSIPRLETAIVYICGGMFIAQQLNHYQPLIHRLMHDDPVWRYNKVTYLYAPKMCPALFNPHGLAIYYHKLPV